MKMFRQFITILCTIMLISIIGCSQPGLSTVVKEQQTEKSSIQDDKVLVDKIKSMGFDTNGYIIADGKIIVEGDISFDIEKLKKEISSQENISSGPLKQYANNYTVSPQRLSKKIYVYITDSKSNWCNAILLAIYNWNNYSGTLVHFTAMTTKKVTPDITISFTYIDASKYQTYVVESEFPGEKDAPGTYIHINTYSDNLKLTDSQKARTMMHELGHTLGLRHNLNSTNIIQIPGSPVYNNDTSSSLMCTNCYLYLGDNTEGNGFSTTDLQAFQYLFGDTGAPYVIVYEHINYAGKRFRINNCDGFDLNTISMSKMISSFKLFNGAKIAIFNENYSSYYYTEQDTPNLCNYNFNDQATSLYFY